MTDFYCCDEFEYFCSEEDFTAHEVGEEYGFEYCPFCSRKLSNL